MVLLLHLGLKFLAVLDVLAVAAFVSIDLLDLLGERGAKSLHLLLHVASMFVETLELVLVACDLSPETLVFLTEVADGPVGFSHLGSEGVLEVLGLLELLGGSVVHALLQGVVEPFEVVDFFVLLVDELT